MGGRLGLFAREWSRITEDSWVLGTITDGYRLEFTETPPLFTPFRTTPVPFDPILASLLREEVRALLAKEAIVPLTGLHPDMVTSMFFLAPKKNGQWRPILNLRPLNKFIVPAHFKMEHLRSILPHLRQGMWATSIDLSDAYLHVPLHPDHRRFVTFAFEGTQYMFRALPFGLSTAPRVFTRITRVMAAYIRRRGIRIFMYLDDWLIVADDPVAAEAHTRWVLDLALRLGWLINPQKSELVPSQKPIFLGAVLDFTVGRIFPTLERQRAVRAGADLLLTRPSSSARAWLVFLGYLASLVEIVPWCRLQMRDLQWHLLAHFRPVSRDLSAPVPLSPSVVPHIQWWRELSHLAQGRSFPPPTPSSVLVTDASLGGWGAHLGLFQIADRWQGPWLDQHINVLELEAVFRALQFFLPRVRDSCVLVRSDNTTTVAYVNRQGGTHSQSLWFVAKRLFTWCQRHGVTLQARHLPGKANTIADLLSRLQGAPTEWSLSPLVTPLIWRTYGRPTVDLFASATNAQLPVFCALSPGGGVWKIDAFSFPWAPALAYAFPPFALIPRVLAKVKDDEVNLLLVALNGPASRGSRRSWSFCLPPRELCHHGSIFSG